MTAIGHLVDCGLNPICPENLRIYDHDRSLGSRELSLKGGDLYFGGKKVELRSVAAPSFHCLVGESFLPANVLDHLLECQNLAPLEWRKLSNGGGDGNPITIFFAGTSYVGRFGQFVRHMFLGDGDQLWRGGVTHLSNNLSYGWTLVVKD